MNAPIRIKTFRSKTLQDAFEQIRNEFGPEASILETKSRKGFFLGNHRIEVTASSAAAEQEESDPNRPDGAEADKTELSRNPETAVQSKEDPAKEFMPVGTHLHDERSSSLRSSGVNSIDRISNQVRKELLEAGLQCGIVDQWLEAVRLQAKPHVWQNAWALKRELFGWVEEMLPSSQASYQAFGPGAMIALVGPPGGGKTIATLKLAAQLSSQSDASIGIVQVDMLQCGLAPVVRRHCDLLGWQTETIMDPSELKLALRRLSSSDIIFLDCHGCSPTNEQELKLLQELLAQLQPTSIQTVLPSTCGERTFLRYLECFEGVNSQGVILTKLDESGSLGPLFSCLASMSLPATFLGESCSVSSPLQVASGNRLAQYVFGMTE